MEASTGLLFAAPYPGRIPDKHDGRRHARGLTRGNRFSHLRRFEGEGHVYGVTVLAVHVQVKARRKDIETDLVLQNFFGLHDYDRGCDSHTGLNNVFHSE